MLEIRRGGGGEEGRWRGEGGGGRERRWRGAGRGGGGQGGGEMK